MSMIRNRECSNREKAHVIDHRDRDDRPEDRGGQPRRRERDANIRKRATNIPRTLSTCRLSSADENSLR